MKSFLSEIKSSSHSSKPMSFLLINIFQIQLAISMVFGTSLNIFEWLQFFYLQKQSDLRVASMAALAVHVSAVLLIVIQMVFHSKNLIKSSKLTRLTAGFLHFYKHLGFIPVIYLVFKTLTTRFEPQSIAISIVNGLIGVGLCYLEQLSCKTYRFRVKNYHQKLINTFRDTSFIIVVIATNCIQSPKYGAIMLIFKNCLSLARVYMEYEEPEIQRTIIFGNLYQAFVSSLVIIAESMSFQLKGNYSQISCVLVFGYFIISHVTQALSLQIYRKMLVPKKDIQNTVENQEKLITQQMNKIRSKAMVLMEQQKYKSQEDNEFDRWWQFYNREVIGHKVWCADVKCLCKEKDAEYREIYLGEIISKISQLSLTFLKEARLTIMSIYQYIQLSKQPLKAYYELTKLKLDPKKTLDFHVELKELTLQSRECFDQLFLKHKVKNQKLQLSKVIEFEELLVEAEQELKNILSETMRFYSLFNHSSVKLSKIKQESRQLSELKAKFESKLFLILNDYSSNTKLTILIHFFYNYVEVYLNKEAELKKITQSQLFKKRFSDKAQVDVFCPDYGAILIDLVEEKGKIKNLTKNMCAAFGYHKQDMIGKNINQFMPRLFGHHHAKFLNNFIEKGKIKLLTYNQREIFGKNKKKFIFPLKVSLKAQYLQDNFFGSSGLVKQADSFSEYILVDRNGKIEQMTESLYRKTFAVSFHQQPQKVTRLQINKLIPSLNFFFDQQRNKYDKIYEGIFIFSQNPGYLAEKFRYVKDTQNKFSKTITANMKTAPINYSISVTNSSSKSELSVLNTARKNQQKAIMADVMRSFITEIDLESVQGYKITYKISQVVTAEFEADLIEIMSLKSFDSEQAFCQTLIEELEQLIQVFGFSLQEHSVAFGQIEEMKCQTKTKSPQNLHNKTYNSSNDTKSNLIAIDAPRQVNRRNSKESRYNQEVKSQEFQQQTKFIEQNEQLLQKESTTRSLVDNLELESKKQVLINTFSNENLSMDSRYSIAVNIFIGLLIALLMCLVVLSAVYLGLLAKKWTSLGFIQQTKQIVEYRSSLEEIELLQQSLKTNLTDIRKDFSFVEGKTLQLTQTLKNNLQTIYESVVDQDAFNNFYTDQLELTPKTINPLTNKLQTSTQKLSLIALLKQLFWHFSQNSSRNTQHFRSSYEYYSMELRELQDRVDNFLISEEEYFYQVISIVNCIYLAFMVLLGIGVVPVYMYFRNEEKALTELLQYISFTELKKSLQKLNSIQLHLNKIDTVNNFNYMKNNFFVVVSAFAKENSDQPIVKHKNNNPRIVTQENNAGSFTCRIIFVGILVIIFLSNLSIFTLTMTTQISSQFVETVQLNKISYELQNKPAYLLNTYLRNVNNFMNKLPEQNYSSQMFEKIQKDYFSTVSEISTPIASKSKIFYHLQTTLNQPLCNLVVCQLNNLNNTRTLDYLVYQFRNRFDFLSQKVSSSINNQQKIPTWLDQNNILQLLTSIQTIISISQHINPFVYQSYKSYIKSLTETILIVNIVFIVVNSIILIVVKNMTFKYFSSSIKDTLSIFRHFDLETLSENTYLTSYFSNKLKESK